MKMGTNYRELFTGLETETPLLDGSKRKYINLDNAASTPALHRVQDTVNDYLKFYSSVHRGTGFKSQLSTHAYEQARHISLQFFGADPARELTSSLGVRANNRPRPPTSISSTTLSDKMLA